MEKLNQIRRAIRYVLQNARKHAIPIRDVVDFYSSARWFRSWQELRPLADPNPPVARTLDPVVQCAHGLGFSVGDLPGSGRVATGWREWLRR